MRADARLALAEVLALAGRPAREAEAAVGEALELYRRKGNLAGTAQAKTCWASEESVGAIAGLDGPGEAR